VAAAQARYICDVADVGYSQPERRSWYASADEAGYVTTPQNADCSSLVCGSICFGLHVTYGVPWGHPALPEIDGLWTGNMRQGLEARGYREVNWDDASLYPDGGFQVGDVVLSAGPEGGAGHVVIITDPAADYLSEAWIAEDGSIDGYAGDTTGGETRTVPYSSHPYTLTGKWTSCHRFDDSLFLSQWPEFAGASAPAPAPAPAAPSASSEPTHAHGIDVSSHQAGIDLAAVPGDFVIVKATEDDDYISPVMHTQAASALDAGKRVGFYHFARPGDAGAQARFFVSAVSSYVGRATLWLDWESDAVAQGPGWALAWLDTVASLTGLTPGVYMNGSAASGYDWSAVAAKYPLWYAGGPDYSDYGRSYTDPSVPSVPYWGAPLVHQYTEDGRLPGYGGSLDLNRLRDRAAWDAMVGATAPADTTTTEEDDMKILGLDFGNGTYGYARLTPGLGAYSMDQATADAFYRAGYRTTWVTGEDFNALVKDSWDQYNYLFGSLAGKKDVEAATAEVLAAVKANAAPKTEEAAA
jgi:lysozyme